MLTMRPQGMQPATSNIARLEKQTPNDAENAPPSFYKSGPIQKAETHEAQTWLVSRAPSHGQGDVAWSVLGPGLCCDADAARQQRGTAQEAGRRQILPSSWELVQDNDQKLQLLRALKLKNDRTPPLRRESATKSSPTLR